jgi:hypothetical protein
MPHPHPSHKPVSHEHLHTDHAAPSHKVTSHGTTFPPPSCTTPQRLDQGATLAVGTVRSFITALGDDADMLQTFGRTPDAVINSASTLLGAISRGHNMHSNTGQAGAVYHAITIVGSTVRGLLESEVGAAVAYDTWAARLPNDATALRLASPDEDSLRYLSEVYTPGLQGMLMEARIRLADAAQRRRMLAEAQQEKLEEAQRQAKFYTAIETALARSQHSAPNPRWAPALPYGQGQFAAQRAAQQLPSEAYAALVTPGHGPGGQAACVVHAKHLLGNARPCSKPACQHYHYPTVQALRAKLAQAAPGVPV